VRRRTEPPGSDRRLNLVSHRVGRVLAAGFVAAALAAGCARVTPASAGSASSPPARPTRGAVLPATPTRTGPGYVVTRVVVPVRVDNSVRLDPPAATSRPRISGSRAFTLARRWYGDPRGTATPRVALTSYTDTVQGTTLAGGGTRPLHHRLVWVVIDYGGTCAGTEAPAAPGSPRPTPVVRRPCLFLSFVDARTGRDLGGMSEAGPGVHDISISRTRGG